MTRMMAILGIADVLSILTVDCAADYVRSALQRIERLIVLVADSYGGAVITKPGGGSAECKALVYIAEFAPDKRESLAQLVTMNPGTQIAPEALIDLGYRFLAGEQVLTST